MKPKVWNKRNPKCPENAVYVGRPTVWGNAFVIGEDGDREACLEMYEKYLCSLPMTYLEELLAPIRGRHLVCHCKPKACHADLLLELANS